MRETWQHKLIIRKQSYGTQITTFYSTCVYLFNQNKKCTYKIGDQNTLAVNSHFIRYF